MNPQWHDEFVALCALFPSGELTEEEWALLQVHLAYCDSCRVAFEEYQRIASEAIPVMADSAAAELDVKPGPTSFSLEAAEQRLMSPLHSMPAHTVSARPRFPGKIFLGVLAACVTLAAGCPASATTMTLPPSPAGLTRAAALSHRRNASSAARRLASPSMAQPSSRTAARYPPSQQ